MSEKNTKTIVRRKNPKSLYKSFTELTDGDRYSMLREYREGISVTNIADSRNLDIQLVKDFFSLEIKHLNTIQETNKLMISQDHLNTTPVRNPTKLLNDDFLNKVDDIKDAYAYWYAMTGSNEFALKECGVDGGFASHVKARTKRYTLSVRGKYLRGLPGVMDYINEVRDSKLADMELGKSYVQSELVEQIEQLKEIAADDPRYRTAINKNIELLGRTVGAFTDNIKIEEVNAKNGLDILMKKAKAQANGGEEYVQDTD